MANDSQESRNAFRGTIVTLGLRILSFVCTQVTLRFLDPTTLGKANIQLELLLTTILFLSREGFRLALTRNLSPENWNVAWLTIPVVTVIAGCALVWHLYVATDSDYRIAGILYCIGSWIEGCAEPAVLHFLRNMDTAKRSSAEALGTLVKAVATVAGLKYFGAQSVTAFGMSQLLYACTYSTYLYWNVWYSLRKPSASFDIPTCSKIFSFTLQGIFKHLLTEADKIVLTTLSDSYNQGVYAMVSKSMMPTRSLPLVAKLHHFFLPDRGAPMGDWPLEYCCNHWKKTRGFCSVVWQCETQSVIWNNPSQYS
jgi:oligosaccharide translocation protein RFT1